MSRFFKTLSETKINASVNLFKRIVYALGLFLASAVLFWSHHAFASVPPVSTPTKEIAKEISPNEITNYNYVCMSKTKSEALVFKTTAPQKIWKTSLDKKGEIQTHNAFPLQNVEINAPAINIEGKVASFKAELAKNYEIKGLFAKTLDEEIPLTVVSTYTKNQNQLKDEYNCTLEKSDAPAVLLGSTAE